MAVQAACDQKSLLETVRKYTRNTPAALEILRSSPCRSTTWGPGMIPRHGTGSFGSSLSKESRGHCSVPQVSGSLGPWVTAVYLRSQGHWSLQCSSGLRVTGSRGHCSVPQVSGSLGHCSVPQVSGSLGHCSVVPQVSGSLGHCSVPQVSGHWVTGSLQCCSSGLRVTGSLQCSCLPVTKSDAVPCLTAPSEDEVCYVLC